MNKLIYFFLYILFSSCETPTTYNVTGVIKEIDLTNNKLLIDHNEIPGFMDKMVMYFNLHQSIDLNNFQEHFLKEAPDEWENYDSIICNPI